MEEEGETVSPACPSSPLPKSCPLSPCSDLGNPRTALCQVKAWGGGSGNGVERTRVWGLNPTALTLVLLGAWKNDPIDMSPGFFTHEVRQ